MIIKVVATKIQIFISNLQKKQWNEDIYEYDKQPINIKRVYIYKDDKQAIIEMNTFEYCENLWLHF